jgi:toxin ParE1/3/4
MQNKTVTEYRLTPAAQRDLDAIWEFTAGRWSVDQAEHYVRELFSDLDLLVQNPKIARESHQLHPPVRLYRSGSHLMIFRIDGQCLNVLRFLHMRQSWVDILTR